MNLDQAAIHKLYLDIKMSEKHSPEPWGIVDGAIVRPDGQDVTSDRFLTTVTVVPQIICALRFSVQKA